MSANGSRMGSFAAARALAAVLAAVLSCLCAGLAATLSPQQAFAADQEPTLTVVVKYGSGSSAVSIDGMELSIYKVASYDPASPLDGYTTLEAYEKDYPSAYSDYEKPEEGKSAADVFFNTRMSEEDAGAAIEAAKKMAETAAGQEATATATTGKDGEATFGPLEWGAYLVVQTGAKGAAAGYETIAPWLVNVPRGEDAGWLYDVVCNPKQTVKPAEEPEPSKSSESPDPSKSSPSPNPSTTTTTTTTTRTTPSTNSSMAKTNDNIDWRITALCAGIGLAALGTAIFASRKLKR